MPSRNFLRKGYWVAQHRVTTTHFSLFFFLFLSHEFPFNCDTSSGLWRTAHPVISRYYLGMRGQVLPVQSMSARCTVPWPLLSIYLYSPRSRENLPFSLDHSSRRCDANFFPFACSTLRGIHNLADRDANHSIIAWPRGARIKLVQSKHGRDLTRKYRVSLQTQSSLS